MVACTAGQNMCHVHNYIDVASYKAAAENLYNKIVVRAGCLFCW